MPLWAWAVDATPTSTGRRMRQSRRVVVTRAVAVPGSETERVCCGEILAMLCPFGKLRLRA